VRGQDDLSALGGSGYEIFDQDFPETGQVVIWSRSALTPKLGEFFNIETGGDLRELMVAQIHTFTGGWTATCRAESD
jgi:hypothetical protein